MAAPQVRHCTRDAFARAGIGLAMLCMLGASGCRDWSELGGDFGQVVGFSDLSTGSSSDGPAANATIEVGADPNQDFTPALVTVASEGSITWVWHGGPHSIVTDSGPTSWTGAAAQSNGTYEVTLVAPGSYDYHCGVHPSQKGSIVVSP